MGNRWGNSGNSVRLYFWGSKITADGDYNNEIKRCLLLGRKVMTNLKVKVKSLSSVQLWDPIDCSLSGSSLHGIIQARILEWVAISFSMGSSQPRDQTQVSRISGRHLTSEPQPRYHNKKQRCYFANKGPSVKAMVFPVVVYGCESWTIKKTDHWRIDAFELCHWRRLLRVPWTARRSNHSILKEISPGVYWKDWCWSWNSNTSATSGEELTHWKRP